MEMYKNIIVTIDEAREMYNSGNKTLKDLALKVFSDDELNPPPYSEIKTFEDAVSVLGMSIDDENSIVNNLKERSKAMAAMYKLNIIRKALNFGQDLHLTMDAKCSFIHYPCNPFVTESSTYYEDDINSGRIEIIGKIKSEGTLYDVLGGYTDEGGVSGFGSFNFYHDVGFADANFAFLGCASKEIAKHIGKYFGMLITEAKFGDLPDFEIIEDKYGNS